MNRLFAAGTLYTRSREHRSHSPITCRQQESKIRQRCSICLFILMIDMEVDAKIQAAIPTQNPPVRANTSVASNAGDHCHLLSARLKLFVRLAIIYDKQPMRNH